MDKSGACIALKFSLSMLTLNGVVWDPNKAIPFEPRWAVIWAGPVSLATTNKLSLINAANWEISKALPLSKTQSALIVDASLISPGPGEIKETSNINALCILDNGKALDISQLASLIKDSSFVVANDTGPAHMTAHLGSKGIALFGSHTTPLKVSIERENFKAIQAPELSKLSAEKVFERLSNSIS